MGRGWRGGGGGVVMMGRAWRWGGAWHLERVADKLVLLVVSRECEHDVGDDIRGGFAHVVQQLVRGELALSLLRPEPLLVELRQLPRVRGKHDHAPDGLAFAACPSRGWSSSLPLLPLLPSLLSILPSLPLLGHSCHLRLALLELGLVVELEADARMHLVDLHREGVPDALHGQVLRRRWRSR